ncbi:MAG TPA: alpha-glucan family phosphorylase [Chroococcales cyanobacterium]
MNLIGKVSVFPAVPERIIRLHELAYNLWWSWMPEAQELYQKIEPELWEKVYHNPIKFLREVDQDRLNTIAHSPAYLEQYDSIMAKFDEYMQPASTWFERQYPDYQGKTIAYFSAEFGLHESLPIYSGGLGILSGDHCKSASDTGLPFVGVGLLYNQGYFKQSINAQGWQEAIYERLNFAELPIQPVKKADGEEDVVIEVELPGRSVFAKVWKVQVGRIPVYLLDTDISWNTPDDRQFSAQLYGGDRDMRISQEIILGIGGVRALKALDIHPYAWHMNEGHSAFLGLERIRELIQEKGLTFQEAQEVVAASSVFTTHTPVPAGNDAFDFGLMDRYFSRYWTSLGLKRDDFLALAKQDQPSGAPLFSMTVLAFQLSRHNNGVSKLHGEVSRSIWMDVWPGVPVEEIPIEHVTNGVHTSTWLSLETAKLFEDYLSPDWRNEIEKPELWSRLNTIPNEILWDNHQNLKEKMIHFVRERLKVQRLRHGESPAKVRLAETLLDPKALTIGFARRFATYKRATLIFRDIERIKRILNDTERPVQIIFAGKAHPADVPGKELIKAIYALSKEEGFKGKVIMLEDYDMNVARYLVQGVDVWLNNPRRPLEASGTSGEKAAINGCLNFSVLDGWWAEGFNGENGWSIGEEREYKDLEEQDNADSASLYATLEGDIIPLYYDVDKKGTPVGWVDKMKESIRSNTPTYSTQRMVEDYCNMFYIPSSERNESLSRDGFMLARQLSDWKGMMNHNWHYVHLEAKLPSEGQIDLGHSIELSAKVRLDGLDPKSVKVEIYCGREDNGSLKEIQVIPMKLSDQLAEGYYSYTGAILPLKGGNFEYGIRVIPFHPEMKQPHELPLIRWA